jgi:hypothetical protein
MRILASALALFAIVANAETTTTNGGPNGRVKLTNQFVPQSKAFADSMLNDDGEDLQREPASSALSGDLVEKLKAAGLDDKQIDSAIKVFEEHNQLGSP